MSPNGQTGIISERLPGDWVHECRGQEGPSQVNDFFVLGRRVSCHVERCLY